MKKIHFVLLLCVCYFFIGCASQKAMYYWGTYSNSLYEYKKFPTDKSLAKHKQTLLKIIAESDERGLRVPPGVYCEYGYILMQEGNKKEASKYYELEEQTYPESKVFVHKLKAQLDLNEEAALSQNSGGHDEKN